MRDSGTHQRTAQTFHCADGCGKQCLVHVLAVCLQRNVIQYDGVIPGGIAVFPHDQPIHLAGQFPVDGFQLIALLILPQFEHLCGIVSLLVDPERTDFRLCPGCLVGHDGDVILFRHHLNTAEQLAGYCGGTEPKDVQALHTRCPDKPFAAHIRRKLHMRAFPGRKTDPQPAFLLCVKQQVLHLQGHFHCRHRKQRTLCLIGDIQRKRRIDIACHRCL